MSDEQKNNTELLERLKALEAKYRTAVTALEFIAFNEHSCWRDADRRRRAATTLTDLGEYVKV